MQGEGCLLLLGVAPGVVDADGGARGDFVGQRKVVRFERVGAPRAPQAHRAQHQAPCGQGHHDQGMDTRVGNVLALARFHGEPVRRKHGFQDCPPVGQAPGLGGVRCELDGLPSRLRQFGLLGQDAADRHPYERLRQARRRLLTTRHRLRHVH